MALTRLVEFERSWNEAHPDGRVYRDREWPVPCHQSIVLEGVPCVGKSTLARSLQEHGSCICLEEERDDDLLEEFFANASNNAFWFQLYKLKKRQLTILSLPFKLPGETLLSTVRPTYVIDRSLPGDMAFALYQYAVGNMKAKHMELYMREASTVAWPKPSVIFYLTAEPHVLCQRVRARGYTSEIAHYDATYFELMDACHRVAFRLCGIDRQIVELGWDKQRTTAAASEANRLSKASTTASVCKYCCVDILRLSGSVPREDSADANGASGTCDCNA